MKKILIILLIVCFVAGTGIVALAELKFGPWHKWDKELPPYDHKDWGWLTVEKTPMPMPWGKDNIVLLSSLYFFRDAKKKVHEEVIVQFYSSGAENIKDWDIRKATFAVAAFRPVKKKVRIIVYEMQDGVFKFFEEYKIPLKNNEPVIPKDAGFRKTFGKFILSQIERVNKNAKEKFPQMEGEFLSTQLLPIIKILKGDNYVIMPLCVVGAEE